MKNSKSVQTLIAVLVVAAGASYFYNESQNKVQEPVTKTVVNQPTVKQPVPETVKNETPLPTESDFVVYSRDPLLGESQDLTIIVNKTLNKQLTSKNFSSDTIGDFVKLRDCALSGGKLHMGLIDPFIYGCLQQKQKNLEILYKQEACNIRSFVIVSKDKGIDKIEDLNGKDITVLGQSRAVVLAKYRFPKDGPINFKDVHLSNNVKLTLRDLSHGFINGFFVIGFNKDNSYSIPLINIDSQQSFEKYYPTFKIIEAKDYDMPCTLIAAENTVVASLVGDLKNKLLTEINTCVSLAKITGNQGLFNISDTQSSEKEIMDVMIKASLGEINAQSIKHRNSKDTEGKKRPEGE